MIRLLFLIMLAAAGGVSPAQAELPPASNLAALGQQAKQQGKPVVLFFYQDQCHYCETVRKQYLEPMSRDTAYDDRILLRKIDTRGDKRITDFKGKEVRQQSFASRERKTFTPPIAFYGPKGERLIRPLVGLKGGRDYYGHYLEKGIEEAETALQELL